VEWGDRARLADHGPQRDGRDGTQPGGPPDFTDPKILLGASPALLEGKLVRGGMGTGMPAWGPILTHEQMDALITYLNSFAFQSRTPVASP
jgi:mono/diheme cytochrome c family protein